MGTSYDVSASGTRSHHTGGEMWLHKDSMFNKLNRCNCRKAELKCTNLCNCADSGDLCDNQLDTDVEYEEEQFMTASEEGCDVPFQFLMFLFVL